MTNKVILSLAAHGDDAKFVAGGTLAKMAGEGHDVYLCIPTDNSRSVSESSRRPIKNAEQAIHPRSPTRNQ